MRPELGYEVRMRIVFAFLSGLFTMAVLVSTAVANGINGGTVIYGLLAAAMMFAATTNRWLIRTVP